MKNRLRDLREDHDLTQQMVADQIGITQRKYSYIETGIQQLTAEFGNNPFLYFYIFQFFLPVRNSGRDLPCLRH